MGAELDHKNRCLQKVCEKERKSYAAGKTQENTENSNGEQKQVKLVRFLKQWRNMTCSI
jgi:hypothetical protein